MVPDAISVYGSPKLGPKGRGGLKGGHVAMITCIIIMIGRTPPPRVYTGTWGAVPAAEPVSLAQADGGGGGEQERDQGTRHITLGIHVQDVAQPQA
jgi:hypothetical protein